MVNGKVRSTVAGLVAGAIRTKVSPPNQAKLGAKSEALLERGWTAVPVERAPGKAPLPIHHVLLWISAASDGYISHVLDLDFVGHTTTAREAQIQRWNMLYTSGPSMFRRV